MGKPKKEEKIMNIREILGNKEFTSALFKFAQNNDVIIKPSVTESDESVLITVSYKKLSENKKAEMLDGLVTLVLKNFDNVEFNRTEVLKDKLLFEFNV